MTHEELLREAEHYCQMSGMKLSTLGVRALGNSRYFERLERRIAKASEDAEKIRAFMADNPISETPEGSAA